DRLGQSAAGPAGLVQEPSRLLNLRARPSPRRRERRWLRGARRQMAFPASTLCRHARRRSHGPLRHLLGVERTTARSSPRQVQARRPGQLGLWASERTAGAPTTLTPLRSDNTPPTTTRVIA